MNVTPPKDKTPNKVNGKITDGTIKNPINFGPIPKNYNNLTIPKKIKIKPDSINQKEIVDKSLKSNVNKIFSSKRDVTPNKKEILDTFSKLFDTSGTNGTNDKSGTNDTSGTNSTSGTSGTSGTSNKELESNNTSDINSISEGIPPDISSVPMIQESEGTEGVEGLILPKDPPRRIKRIIRKKLKKAVVPKVQKEIKSNTPNYEKMTEDERIIHRNDFILKFDLLRKWHSGLNIQKGIEHHPNLTLVHTVYELYLGCIYNEINSNFYRGILLVTWLGLDLFGTYVLGLDTSTYLKDQIKLMWAYEPIINEMAKVNFYNVVEGWSPFQKLIGLVFGSYVFIIIVKLVLNYIGKKVGHNLESLTSTVVDFMSSMIFAKPKENSIPPILINNNGNTQNSTSSINLEGIHNIPIPQPSSLSSSNQINMAEGAINLINNITGRAGNKSTAAPSSSQSSQPSQSSQSSQKPKSRFVAPSF